jgi:ribonuclease BN (tRNA processing enzyme)
MRLTVLGCGDAFGSGGRLNTCFQLDARRRDDGRATRVLVDCGASALVSMRRVGTDPDSIDGIALTHLHGDHFGGLPFLLLYLQFEAGRTRSLEVTGPPGTAARIDQAAHALFGACNVPWDFPLEIRELEAGSASTIAGLSLETVRVHHGKGIEAHALRLSDGQRTFAYSGDTRWVDALIDVADGADLFVAECYAFDEQLPTHTDYATLSTHLDALNARRVMLTHMSEPMLARLDEAALEGLSDGLIVEL